MHVSLTPELEEYVRDKVRSGLYNNSSEVVREALRLLKRRDAIESAKFERLKKDIEQGIESVRREGTQAFDMEEFIAAMRRSRVGRDG